MFRELYGLNKFNRTSGGQQFSKQTQATVLLSTKNCIRFTSKNFCYQIFLVWMSGTILNFFAGYISSLS